MSAGPLRDALTLLLGVVTGALSGMFGIGGAVVSQPGLRALGAAPLVAVGTTLPSILPGALSGTIGYHRARLVDWRAVVLTAPVGVSAAVGCSFLAHAIPGDGHLLLLVTAALLGSTALRMVRGGPDEPGEEGDRPPASPRGSAPALSAVGLAAGALSGLLGIGGGVLMVPAFSQLVGFPLKRAIATSLACVGVFAVPSTVTHALLGDVDWRFALWLTIGVVPGAWLGARITIVTAERRVRLATAVVLGLVALVYAGSELPALLEELR